MIDRKLRKRKCKAPDCDRWFNPFNSFQKVCSVPCAQEYGILEAARIERREIKAAKQRLKTRSQWLKDAQEQFNRWVRIRDAHKPCISCGRYHDGQWHAGHYRTTQAAPELRFEPLNCHKQCAPCNNHKSGDIVNYRINLVKRIGAENVAWLEKEHPPKKYTADDLRDIRNYYRAAARELTQKLESA